MTESKLIYTDLLDSVRVPALSTQSAVLSNKRIAIANMMMSVILGDKPVLSQTQAFDSSVIHEILESDDATDFLDLVRKGNIQVRLFNKKSVLDAFSAAVSNEEFLLSGWPEVAMGKVDRSDLNACVQKDSEANLPDTVAERLEALRAFSDAVSVFPASPAELPKKSFASWLAYAESTCTDLDIGALLSECKRRGLTKRSECYNLVAKADAADFIKESTLQVLDTCYNLTICDSLRVGQAMLTTDRIRVANVVSNVLSEHVVRQTLFTSSEMSGLETLSWEKVNKFVIKHGRHSRNSRKKMALVAGALAEVRCESRGLACNPKLLGSLTRIGSSSISGLCGSVICTSLGGEGLSGFGGAVGGLVGGIIGEKVSAFVENGAKEFYLEKFKSAYFGMLDDKRGVVS